MKNLHQHRKSGNRNQKQEQNHEDETRPPELWVPRAYQVTSFVRVLREHTSGLLLDPGLGKTSIILTAVKLLFKRKKIRGVLVIAPLRPMYNTWLGERAKWLNFNGLRMAVLHGTDEEKAKALRSKAHVYLINPEGLPWLKRELIAFKAFPFDMLVVDESTKFKNFEGKRFKKFLKPLLQRFTRRYILTGTPTPKSYLDIFAQTFIVDLGKTFGPHVTYFKHRYFIPGGYKGKELKIMDGASRAIENKLKGIMLVLRAEDHLDMPELVINDIYITLPKVAYAKYKEMEDELFLELEEYDIRAANSAVLFDKCHQIANGCIYEDQDPLAKPIPSYKRRFTRIHNAKLEALYDLHEELQFKPLLTGYKYHHDLVSIKGHLKDPKLPYIGSRVSSAEVNAIEKKWNAGKIPLLLGQPSSMAYGLNLQEAGTNVCFFSLDSNYDEYCQFYKRVYRSGVKGNKVVVHRLIAENTVDELIVSRLDNRNEQQMSFLDALNMYRKRKQKCKSRKS